MSSIDKKSTSSGCIPDGPDDKGPGNERQPPGSQNGNDNSSAQEIDESMLCTVLNMLSALFAIEQSQISCKIHENCNGACGIGDVDNIQYPSLVYGSAGTNMILKPRSTVSFPETRHISEQKQIDFGKLNGFVYDPLPIDGSMIRLIKVHSAVFIADALEIELLPVEFAASPTYAALSYHWGGSQCDHSIVCNGKHLQITQSLYKALLRHRRHQHKEGETLIWADFLCINQKYAPELNSQLRIMGSIYSHAARVIVDLGDEVIGDVKYGFYHGLDLMDKLATLNKFAEETKHMDLRQRSDLVHFGLPEEEHGAWLLFGSLFECPWFRRTWIVQEVVLAQSIDCRYGPFTFEWQCLEDAFTFLTKHNMFLHQSEPAVARIGKLNARHIIELRTHHKAAAEAKGWLSPMLILRLTREFEVTKAKDKIIGLLGLLPPTSQAGENAFDFDASWSTEKVYHRFAGWVVTKAWLMWGSWQSIEMLSYAGLSRRSNGAETSALPSWAPDWRAQSITVSPKPFIRIRTKDYHVQSRNSMHVVIPLNDGPIPECFDFDAPEPKRLLLRGWYFDTITSISDSDCPVGIASLDARQKAFLWHQKASELLCQRTTLRGCTPYENLNEALVRTLLANDLNDGENAVDGLTHIVDPTSTYSRFLDFLSSGRQEDMESRTFKSSANETFSQQLRTVCKDRRLAVTSKGYIGMVPSCTVVGDCVAIFAGVSVPFIIRCAGKAQWTNHADIDEWQLVGEAYIHGIMEEEEVAEGFEVENQEPIVLC